MGAGWERLGSELEQEICIDPEVYADAAQSVPLVGPDPIGDSCPTTSSFFHGPIGEDAVEASARRSGVAAGGPASTSEPDNAEFYAWQSLPSVLRKILLVGERIAADAAIN